MPLVELSWTPSRGGEQMVDLKQLITVAPFPQDVKTELLQKADSFSPEKKFELEEMCWSFISTDYQNKLQYEMQKAVISQATGQPAETPDLAKIEEKLLAELTQKLTNAATTEQIGEVREKLKEVQTKGTSEAPQS